MYSKRFTKEVQITRHAAQRMHSRAVSERELSLLIEEGQTRFKDSKRFWIAHFFEERCDNLLCVPVVYEKDLLVVKTVMHHFSWEG